jgi:hypothetical protein
VESRRRILLVGAALAAAALGLSGFRDHTSRPEAATPPPAAHDPVRLPDPPPARPRGRPPQFVVVSFDGSGGSRLWTYWRSVARRADAHFTFFVSGVYLLDWSRRTLYRPPRHELGSSDIGFALESEGGPLAMLRQIAAAYREGHEIGTHYNGHFCAPYPGSVGEWTAADWTSELSQFDEFLFRANRFELPFGPAEVVGGRTPCLQGDLSVLYPVLARLGFRYDASRQAPLGTWPRRIDGIWAVPLLEIPFVGHTFRVVSMDYNLLANQVEESPVRVEQETYASLLGAFRASYQGGRAPLSIGFHFETWDSWAYDHALTRLLVRVCGLRDVRCVSIRELVDWLDAARGKNVRVAATRTGSGARRLAKSARGA